MAQPKNLHLVIRADVSGLRRAAVGAQRSLDALVATTLAHRAYWKLHAAARAAGRAEKIVRDGRRGDPAFTRPAPLPIDGRAYRNRTRRRTRRTR
ncbi:hypothetical protein [Saccharothrix texasensis]|uniref:Uncharacterized protein n=1 Tax=Saccharothrix texasensis TaxID=103734 RepID=A0A3N1H1B6_9PSEU|nr:hypothetical protein [Saccharothrix texasensis]ROP36269.1 hypothetical protein EDD40_1534 [Saccharothrix texasensis]